MSYPLLAAKNSNYVDEVYVSSDSKEILSVGEEFGAKTITRPSKLATSEATIESAFSHGYEYIK